MRYRRPLVETDHWINIGFIAMVLGLPIGFFHHAGFVAAFFGMMVIIVSAVVWYITGK